MKTPFLHHVTHSLPLLTTVCLSAFGSLASAAPRNVPIVDFGDDYCWHGGPWGLPTYRNQSVTQLYKGSSKGENTVDVDGDGDTSDDSTAYYEFSMEEPLSLSGSHYNMKGNNHRFYGGHVSFFANKKPKWSEGGVNIDHELRDDFNLHSYATEGGKIGVRTFGLWLWKKQDFINDGNQNPVCFDADSRIAVYISRYWKDYEEGRFVVKDGDQFYISKHKFGGKTHTLYELKPSEGQWASYNPHAPYNIEFAPSKASFAKHDFKDIQAVGWYIAKPTLGPASLWVKWYAFGVDAIVQRPDAPSHILDMATSGKTFVTKSPVTYAQWRTIHKWSNRNQCAMHPGYVYDRDGDMGSMDTDDASHSASDPVSDITWIDAALWCNALSEYEGLTPCFYEDEACTKVLRIGKERLDPAKYGWKPTIFIQWKANGFRPALSSEEPSKASGLIITRSDQPASGDTAAAIEHWKKRYQPNDLSSVATDPGLNMIAIPGGTYKRKDGAITKLTPFNMSETEITFKQWKQVCAWAAQHGYTFDRDGDLGSMDWTAPGATFTQDHPVTQISHNDAMIWCNALSEMQGKTPVYYTDKEKTKVYKKAYRFRPENLPNRLSQHTGTPDKGIIEIHEKWESDGYRLPSVWEWDYAYYSPGGKPKAYPWNKGQEGEQAWYGENSGDQTHPVKQKQPNTYGLYDMAGNAYEITIGGKNSYYIVDNPRGHGYPIIKGGSFRTIGPDLFVMKMGEATRTAIHSPIAQAYPEIGFRVVQCKAGTHPPEPPPYEPATVLDFDARALDSN